MPPIRTLGTHLRKVGVSGCLFLCSRVAAKKAKLYDKAKQELLKSVGLNSSYDALLALGQVYLALEQASSAFDACSQALQVRPGDDTARSCVDEAKKTGA